MKSVNICSRYLIFVPFIVCPLICFHLTMDAFSWRKGDYNILRNSIRSNERQNIVFLKTHKCGSSTVQNILLRYGYLRNLNFVLPTGTNYLGHPKHFSKSMIPSDVRTETNKYNIFTHHTRFNYTSIKEIMNNDAVFVTILRSPVSLFESLYSYYSLGSMYKGKIDEIISYPNVFNKVRDLRYLGKIGINQMSFDLGLSDKYFDKKDKVDKFIEIIDEQFDLVMILEYIEASLVLLSKLMNWPLTNVQFLPINARTNNRRTYINHSESQKIVNINQADAKLYDFFLKRFRNTIINHYGIKNMINDVNTLINSNVKLYTKCVKQLNEKGYANTQGYDLKLYDDWLCNYATKNELNFTKDVILEQKSRLKAVKKLKTFLYKDT